MNDPDRDARLTTLYLDFMFDLVAREPLEPLHWGYWEDDTPDLAAAQQRYTEMLLALLPAAVRTAWDVGCGLGAMLPPLLQKGIQVEGLTPRKDHAALLLARGLPVTTARFEDCEIDEPVDLLLFAESWNFFEADLDAHLERCHHALRPGGWILAADLFSDASRQGLADRFEIQMEQDVSAAVAPTPAALEARLKRWTGGYDRLLRQTLAVLDPDLSAQVEERLANVPNDALRMVFDGQAVEEQMLSDRAYRFILARRRD
ncbi:MAG: class I SAM-dependent methyltransferase [Myxococcota bacterium]